ncbi:transposase [Niallia sp. XMNu-256]|uniref:RNA-guided endonuclease InsQ/TnpB family protein n=1 Tax=Niallia sp. XMNu-256 TaxID=3082444 RepID=UPI0030D01A4F
MNKETEAQKEYRTYQIKVKKGNRLFSYFDDLCSNANNLYNTTNFYIRQVYTALMQDKPLQPLQQEVMETIYQNIDSMNNKQTIAYYKKILKEKSKPESEQKKVKLNLFELPSKEELFVGYNFLDCLFKTIKQKDYVSLPGQINQQVMKNCIQNWKSYFKSLKDYQVHPDKYKARPNIPGYLQKGSRKEVTLSNQICKIVNAKYLRFPKTNKQLNIGKLSNANGKYQQVRIIPNYDYYTLEIVFLLGVKSEILVKTDRCMGIDLGIENIATLVFNTSTEPILFKGGKIKAINQWYNKLRSYYYAALRNGKGSREGSFDSKKLRKLKSKRSHQINDLFHKISYNIVNIAKSKEIETIVIGRNMDWKQESNLGKRNNQNFVQIPHSLLVDMITYKAKAEGIAVVLNEESYTSKASFFDEDDIPTYQAGNDKKYIFSGKRISRGLYRSKNGIFLNADINGAANILRKVVPKAFANGIAAVCSQPLVVNVR